VKITNVESFPVWGGHKNYFFVVVDTDEGISGVGEGGISGRELGMQGVVEHFKSFLIGQEANRIELLWQQMSRGGFFPASQVTSAALSAIDIALWDIKGKALGVPVYELFGGRARDRVVCYPHSQGASRDLLLENARRQVAEGWTFLRWNDRPRDGVFEPARAIRETVADFELLRRELGEEVELCFDLHTRLDPSDAIRLCRAVEPYRPFFMEDPIRSESMQSLRQVRQQVSVPLAVGEQFSSKWEFRQVIEEELTDYARIDLCIVGGLTEAKKIAGWCETHYIRVVTHNPLGPVSTAACLQLNLAIPNLGVQEQPARPGTVLTDLVPVQPEWADGYLLPSTRPGLGIEFDREAARAHPFRLVEMPTLRARDGSVTNW
jgi:galactonate dehydratase